MEFYYTASVDDLPKTCMSVVPNVPLLLPASSWQRVGFKTPNLPANVKRRAADSGGFVATFKWGDYRYSSQQYVDWLEGWRPDWAATMDYCCEPEVLGSSIVRERQDRTSEMARHFWRDYRDAAWTWVPTLQGWEIDDYRQHARELRLLIREMQQADETGNFRVGIGTLCRRASVSMIHRVVRAVVDELPGIPLHLWGVKLGAIQSPLGLPNEVVSVDSAAWNNAFKTEFDRQRTERLSMGLTERQHFWIIELPRYRAKVEAALASPKQPLLL